MSDIFVSYAREDLERIRPIVSGLAAEGWSPHSVESDWVIEEAEQGKARPRRHQPPADYGLSS